MVIVEFAIKANFTDRSKAVFLLFCMLSRLFKCCLVVTCWERADLLALGDVYCIFVTFPCGILGQVWYSIVLFSDLC